MQTIITLKRFHLYNTNIFIYDIYHTSTCLVIPDVEDEVEELKMFIIDSSDTNFGCSWIARDFNSEINMFQDRPEFNERFWIGSPVKPLLCGMFPGIQPCTCMPVRIIVYNENTGKQYNLWKTK